MIKKMIYATGFLFVFSFAISAKNQCGLVDPITELGNSQNPALYLSKLLYSFGVRVEDCNEKNPASRVALPLAIARGGLQIVPEDQWKLLSVNAGGEVWFKSNYSEGSYIFQFVAKPRSNEQACQWVHQLLKLPSQFEFSWSPDIAACSATQIIYYIGN